MPRQLPPHLSDVLHRLSQIAEQFIELHGLKKDRMQAIANELGGISIEVNKMQKSTNATRMVGGVLGGLGIVGVAAALFAGGSSAAEGAGKMAIIGSTAVICGGAAAVITANVTKLETEKISMNSVEELGKEFMEIVELQQDVLEQIKKVSEELEEKSSSLMTTTREQAKRSLLKSTELQKLLKKTTELSERSRQVMDVTLNMLKSVRELLNYIFSITRITPTFEEDAKFRKCITDAALQCEKTVHEFGKMRNTLKDFEEMQRD